MIITDLETWMLDFGGDYIYRMLEYRRPGDWTPYELEHKFRDASQYVDDHYTFIIMKEVIELPDKDVLIGYKDVTYVMDDTDRDLDKLPIEYIRLSQIKLCRFPEDKFYEDEEEGF